MPLRLQSYKRLGGTMLGRHFLVDYAECDVKIIDDVTAVERHLLKAAELANATVIDSIFHRFSPQGVSGVVVIAESHISIHTWPELGKAAVDIFSCGEKMNALIAIDYLKTALKAKQVRTTEIAR